MFFVFLIIGIGAFVCIGRMSQSRNLNTSFRRLANVHAGIMAAGSIFRRPYADIWHEGISLRVNCYREPGVRAVFGEYTQVEIPWEDSDIWALVAPRRSFSFLARLLSPRIQTGNDAFDRTFMIHSSQPEKVLELISAGAQAQMDTLRHACSSHHLEVEWADGRIFFRKKGLLTDYRLLQRYVNLCIDLYRQFELSTSAGIEIVDEKMLVQPETTDFSDEHAVCMICGDDIDHGIVYCRTCETPHHLDCWKYNGNCSTYGCGETHFITQRRMKRIQAKKA